MSNYVITVLTVSLGFGLMSFLPLNDASRRHVKRIAALSLAAVCILPLFGKAKGVLDGTDLPKTDICTGSAASGGESDVAGLIIARGENDIEKYLAEKGIYLTVDIDFSKTAENEYLIKSVKIRSKTALSSSAKIEIKTAVFEYLGYDGVEILFTEG